MEYLLFQPASCRSFSAELIANPTACAVGYATNITTELCNKSFFELQKISGSLSRQPVKVNCFGLPNSISIFLDDGWNRIE